MANNDVTKKVPMELICMLILRERDMYGYEMVQEIKARSGELLAFNLASVYVVLRRLEENGYVTFITIYGQTQELSKEWFADLQKIENPAEAAATAWNGAALVIWGSDDEAVSPSISESVATALNAQTQDATGEGHGYGFYSEDDAVRNLVASSAADFFAANLK